MSLNLDERQRAMLLEMGVRVWQPEPALVEAPATPEPRAAVATGPALGGTRPASAASTATRPQAQVPHASTAPAAPAMARAPRPDAAAVAQMDWPALEAAVSACQACALCASRKNTVFGVGSTQARWLVVGEAPGENEDLQGQPFVGQAGQLLDNMLKALGLSRQGEGSQAVYIANVLKCRPPANRNPHPDEVAQCEPFLQRQVALLQPTVILAMGKFAAQSLLQESVPDVQTRPLGKLRGEVHRYQGVPVVVSYHPAYLLRTPLDKAKAWADLCLARSVALGTQT